MVTYHISTSLPVSLSESLNASNIDVIIHTYLSQNFELSFIRYFAIQTNLWPCFLYHHTVANLLRSAKYRCASVSRLAI